MAANILADDYQNVCNLNMPKERIKEVDTSTKKKLQQNQPQESMTQDFTPHELNYAIRLTKMKKAPGQDGITNEMIHHLGPRARLLLLKCFNQSWNSGKFPTQWKEAIIIPILKKGKEIKRQNKLQTDQPTKLPRKTNGENGQQKTLKLPRSQTGFRRNRNTTDQIVYPAQEIENAFQEKNKVMAVFVDLTKAFDKVWKKGLLLKLAENGVNRNMYPGSGTTYLKEQLESRWKGKQATL